LGVTGRRRQREGIEGVIRGIMGRIGA